jgi:hypothetical protein
MSSMTARAISTVGIWLGAAIVLAAGVFQHNWTGDLALLILFLIVVAVCGAAAGSTSVVWHGSGKPAEAPSSNPARATGEPDATADRDPSTAFREK